MRDRMAYFRFVSFRFGSVHELVVSFILFGTHWMYRDRPSGFVKWWINFHGHDGNTKIVYI